MDIKDVIGFIFHKLWRVIYTLAVGIVGVYIIDWFMDTVRERSNK